MTANNIYGNIWLGDANDSLTFNGYKISVRGEDLDMEIDGTTPYSILNTIYVGNEVVTREVFNTIIEDIEYHSKKPVLIYCTGGIDRSPFVVLCWLVLKKRFTVEDAYDLIKSKRPIIIEHYEWVDKLRQKNIFPNRY